MKLIQIILLSLLLVMTLSSSSTASPKEHLKKMTEVVFYCNTNLFVENMVKKDYNMQLAAGGLVHDDKRKELSKMSFWINSATSQWAIVFIYKEGDLSCVLGGNGLNLHTP